jgi:hypothetical protein
LGTEGRVKQPPPKSCQNRKPIDVTAVTEQWDFRMLEMRNIGGGMTILDYVAIDVLVLLAVWAVADWIPRDKL